MRGTVPVLFAAFLLAGCLGSGGGKGGHAPAWEEGWSWTYSVVDVRTGERYEETQTVVDAGGMDGDLPAYTLRIVADGAERLANVTRRDLNPIVAGREVPFFRFPLREGKAWNATVREGGPEDVIATYHGRVMGPGTTQDGGEDASLVRLSLAIERRGVSPSSGPWQSDASYEYLFSWEHKNTARFAWFSGAGELLRIDELLSATLK